MLRFLLFSVSLSAWGLSGYGQGDMPVILKNIMLIDGSGAGARSGVSLLIQADTIAAVFPAGNNYPPGNARELDMSGKTVIPLLVNGHGHPGLLKGKTVTAENYTADNMKRLLVQYLDYGVGDVLSLGTDQPIAFDLRDQSQKGDIPGATFFTAGYGFGAAGGVPPAAFGPHIQRPATPAAAAEDMRKLAALRPDFVKIWVDGPPDGPRVTPGMYKAIIEEAHRHHIKVAAHVYYLEDARQLVDAGIDLLAHSIRDKEVDDALITAMKTKGVYYIPTLTIDQYNFIYATTPEWINDPFFIRSLEPGVWEMLKSDAYRKEQQDDKDRERKMKAFRMAMRNVYKLDSAGVKVAMGTDSGAQPVRAIGFSEHLEMQLMTAAGISPLRVITSATGNGAALLGATKRGVLTPGKKADLMVLDADPLKDIKATRSISAIWKDGKRVK